MREQDVGVGAVAARRVQRGARRVGQEPAQRGAQCRGRFRDLLHLGDGRLLGAVRRRGRQQRRYVDGGDVRAQRAVGEVGGLVQPAQQPLPDQAEVRAELHPQRVAERVPWASMRTSSGASGSPRSGTTRAAVSVTTALGDRTAQRVGPRGFQVGALEPLARRAQDAAGLPHGGEVRVVPAELVLPGRVVGVEPGDGGGQPRGRARSSRGPSARAAGPRRPRSRAATLKAVAYRCASAASKRKARPVPRDATDRASV